VASARALPGSMAPVMSMLFAVQIDIMTSSASDLKEALKHFDKAPDVSTMGMFTNHPDDIGASMRVLEDVTTMVEYCATYGMGHITMEQKFHLSIVSVFAKELQKLWQASYRAAPAGTTGIGQGRKIYVAFLKFFAAYSTTSDKRKVLQMADAFSYNVQGFKATWRDHGMGHITMEATRRCEIVVDKTLALDANWGKFHNPWENARPRQVKRWGEGREADKIRFRMYLCAQACPFGVYLAFHL